MRQGEIEPGVGYTGEEGESKVKRRGHKSERTGKRNGSIGAREERASREGAVEDARMAGLMSHSPLPLPRRAQQLIMPLSSQAGGGQEV